MSLYHDDVSYTTDDGYRVQLVFSEYSAKAQVDVRTRFGDSCLTMTIGGPPSPEAMRKLTDEHLLPLLRASGDELSIQTQRRK